MEEKFNGRETPMPTEEIVKDRQWASLVENHFQPLVGTKWRDQSCVRSTVNHGRKLCLGTNATPKFQLGKLRNKGQGLSLSFLEVSKILRRKIMWPKQPKRNSFKESVKAVEADIRHANSLAAMLPRDYGGFCIQMRLHYSPFAPFLLHLIEWMDCSCTDSLPSFLGLFHILLYKVYVDGKPLVLPRERKATLREFYAVIYPSLRQLQSGHVVPKEEASHRKRIEDQRKISDEDLERDEECGICMENCRNVVLPNCGHSMCLNCFQDWSARSHSCPFCRSCLNSLSSGDLWILTDDTDVIDTETLAKENLLHFYLYIENLPLFPPEISIFVPDYLF